MDEPRFRSARYYYSALRKRKLSRTQLFALMQQKLKQKDQFLETSFDVLWPGFNDFPDKAVVLQNTFFHGYGEYTELWFLFNPVNEQVYYSSKISDIEWDKYTYSYDQGMLPLPQQLSFAKAITEIFDFKSPIEDGGETSNSNPE